jgi:predicted nucleotidyltransferase
MDLIEKNRNRIIDICSRYKVAKLFVFGSVLTNRFNEESDVDFVVGFDNVALPEYADNYFDLKSELEKILNRKVDLLEEKAIRNPFLRKSIDSSKVLVYG